MTVRLILRGVTRHVRFTIVIREVLLNPLELALAMHIAEYRDGTHPTNTHLMGAGGVDSHYIGACGEIAYAKLFNLYPNFGDIEIPWDVIHDGYWLDIKCNKSGIMYIHPKCAEKESLDGFAYMHMVGDNRFLYCGIIGRKKLIEQHQPVPCTYSDAYVIRQKQLTIWEGTTRGTKEKDQ